MFRVNPLITWCAVFGYMVIALGLPLPGVLPPINTMSKSASRMAGKDRTVSFPCMNKPCGCITATQCFRECCCHTPAEMLAWARSQDVSREVLVVLQQRAAKADKPLQSCCDDVSTSRLKDLTEVCFEYEYLSAADDSNCGAPLPVTVTESECQPNRHGVAPVSEHMVVLRALLACGGMTSQWLVAGVCLLPADVVVVAYGQPLVQPILCGDLFCSCQRAEPATPPPRAV